MQTKTKVYYEMFSEDGEIACQELVNKINDKIGGGKIVTTKEIQELYDRGREEISKTHGEVYDTEPRWKIAREINNALKEAGYAFKFDGWGTIEFCKY